MLLLIFETSAENLTPMLCRNQFDVSNEGKNVKMEETKWIHTLHTDVFKKLSFHRQINLPAQINFSLNTVKKTIWTANL